MLEKITIEDIKRLIPHRYPFLFVDKVEEIVVGERISAVKNISINEGIFQGHFPGHPIFPGVLIIEALAQAAGVLVGKTLESQGVDVSSKVVYFMSIESAKFRKPVVPGDQLILEVSKKHARATVWKFEGKALVEGKVVAEGIFTAMMIDK
jgi:3-hydroxyacyl-[acyl-carrier-protein] dehydratase